VHGWWIDFYRRVREESGWKLNKSSYEKLRLSSSWASAGFRDAGFEIECAESAGRLLMVAARKQIWKNAATSSPGRLSLTF
jgi:hypothetical protein